MLAAYFDESGTSDADDIALFGGAVTTTLHWACLERPWRKQVHSYGVSTYHASHCQAQRGEYERVRREDCSSLTDYLSCKLAKLPSLGFVSGVFRKEFRYCPKVIREEAGDDPLGLALHICFQHVATWARELFSEEPVAFVFAKHQKYQSIVEKVYDFYGNHESWGKNIGSLSFSTPGLLVELQAADLIAYEGMRFARDSEKPNYVKRQAWKNLERKDNAFRLSSRIHNAGSLAYLATLSVEKAFEQLRAATARS
jgi:hypothetical protein